MSPYLNFRLPFVVTPSKNLCFMSLLFPFSIKTGISLRKNSPPFQAFGLVHLVEATTASPLAALRVILGWPLLIYKIITIIIIMTLIGF